MEKRASEQGDGSASPEALAEFPMPVAPASAAEAELMVEGSAEERMPVEAPTVESEPAQEPADEPVVFDQEGRDLEENAEERDLEQVGEEEKEESATKRFSLGTGGRSSCRCS